MKNHLFSGSIYISVLSSCATDPQLSDHKIKTYGDLCGRIYGETINRASVGKYDVEAVALNNLENKYFSSLSEEEMFRYLISKTVGSRLEGEKMITFIELVKSYKKLHGENRLVNFINKGHDTSFDVVQTAISGSRVNSIENLRSAIRHID